MTWTLHIVGHAMTDKLDEIVDDFTQKLQDAGHEVDKVTLNTDTERDVPVNPPTVTEPPAVISEPAPEAPPAEEPVPTDTPPEPAAPAADPSATAQTT